MARIGLVPARGGSKGVPGKNIKPLGGIPLIGHTLMAAGASKRLDHVIVSTDSAAIGEVAKEFGYAPPFLRPADLAGDDTPDRPVMRHLIQWWRHHSDEPIDCIVYLRPTTPFKTGELIDAAIDRMEEDERFTGLRTVSPVTGPAHPYWTYAEENGMLTPFVAGIDETRYLGRQRLPACWRPNGLVDVLLPEVIEQSDRLYGTRIGYVPVADWRAADIDTPLDFQWCAFIMERMQKNAGDASGED